MLEKDRPPTAEVVKQIDSLPGLPTAGRTCPSGVTTCILVDQARVRIERDYSRPLAERASRAVLAGAAAAEPVSRQHDHGAPSPGRLWPCCRVRACRDTRPVAADQGNAGARAERPAGAWTLGVFAAVGERRAGWRCWLRPAGSWRRASTKPPSTLLTRHGIEVVLVRDEQCCGALTHHLGQDGDELARRAATSPCGKKEAEQGGLDAILVYGVELRNVHARTMISWCARTTISRVKRDANFRAGQDITEYSRRPRAHLNAPERRRKRWRITRLARCSTDRKSQAFRKNCFPRMDSW